MSCLLANRRPITAKTPWRRHPTPYEYVGIAGNAGDGSVVYLGNGWGTTAEHVAIGTYGYAQIYEPSMGTYENLSVDQTIQLTNPGAPAGETQSDLQLVHFTSNPGLAPMTIANDNQLPTGNQSVTLIGDDASQLSYDSNNGKYELSSDGERQASLGHQRHHLRQRRNLG